MGGGGGGAMLSTYSKYEEKKRKKNVLMLSLDQVRNRTKCGAQREGGKTGCN